MATSITRSTKAKITVTLSSDIVRQLDNFLDSQEAVSRSRLVEEAIGRWLEEQAQRELECKTEEYYLSLSGAERDENQQWSKVTARSAKHLWDK